MRPSFLKKQIPTLLGISLLVVGLVVGVLFIGSGGSLNFAPRAAPQTTPKQVKLTNVGDSSFTVSFMTDEVSNGFVKYGTDANSITKQASDDRDQLTGSVGQYTTHHITIRNLQPNTQYYYTIGTVSVPKFDNNGTPFTVKTGPKLGSTPAAKTAYGTVTGTGIDGAIVYLQVVGAGELSALVKNSGSWAIPLSTARTADGTKLATLDPTTDVTVTAQGQQPSNVMTIPAKVSELQPLPPIALTGAGAAAANTTSTASLNAPASNTRDQTAATAQIPITNETPTASPVMSSLPTSAPVATTADTATLPPANSTFSTPSESPAVVATQNPVVDVQEKGNIVVADVQPTITGTAPANATISITIHSAQEIKTTTKANADGTYTVDLEQLGKSLAPGEHTVTVSYKNAAGKTVTEVKKFTVEVPTVAATNTSLNSSATSDSTLLALASSSPQPYGTSNPYTIPSPTLEVSPSPTATASPVATHSAIPKSGAVEDTMLLLLGGSLLIGLGLWGTTLARRSQLSTH